MRSPLICLLIVISSLTGHAQSHDEKLINAMNSGNWFALDSIYNAAPKDSVMPFIEVFSRCLIGNRLNRPDVSVNAFAELFKDHSASLGIENLLSSTIMYSTDLSRTGRNEMAAAHTKAVLDATRQYLDTTWTESLEECFSKYNALSGYKPYGITFTEQSGRIPFRIVPVGEEKHGSVLMHLENSSINGNNASITFDTGAGVNMISDSLAKKFNLIPIDGYATVAGIENRKGQYAIAREIRIGNITVSDVPFIIMDFKIGNTKADQYSDCFSILLGSELMLQLKDMTIDFINREITVAPVAPQRSNVAPNMCFGAGMNLNVSGNIAGTPVLMNIDTGDAAYGTLGHSFYVANKTFIEANAESDTIRRAGIGGVIESLCYRLPAVPVSMGGHTLGVPGIVVSTSQSTAAMDLSCNIGIRTLMMFGRVRFNMVDFVMTTDPQGSTLFNNLTYKSPNFKLPKEKKPSALETIGFIAVEVLKAMIDNNVIHY